METATIEVKGEPGKPCDPAIYQQHQPDPGEYRCMMRDKPCPGFLNPGCPAKAKSEQGNAALGSELDAARAIAGFKPEQCLSCGGVGGHQDGCNGTTGLQILTAQLAAANEKLATLAANVEKLRRHHLDIGEDCWFNCPKSGECCNDGAGDECDCGADEHNKLVDEIILAATKKE